ARGRTSHRRGALLLGRPPPWPRLTEPARGRRLRAGGDVRDRHGNVAVGAVTDLGPEGHQRPAGPVGADGGAPRARALRRGSGQRGGPPRPSWRPTRWP